MMTWACKLILVTEEGRDVVINHQLRSLEILWQRALVLRTWLSGLDLEEFGMTWNVEMEYPKASRARRQDRFTK